MPRFLPSPERGIASLPSGANYIREEFLLSRRSELITCELGFVRFVPVLQKPPVLPFNSPLSRNIAVYEVSFGPNSLKKWRSYTHSAGTYQASQFVLFLRVELLELGI
jgi:hypothetical protein